MTISNDDLVTLIRIFLAAKSGFDKEFARFQDKGLPDFDRITAIETDMFHLKSLCHDFARRDGMGTKRPLQPKDLLDLIVSSIFHEMLHLKEYVYTIKTHRPRYIEFNRKMAREKISPAKREFLRKIRDTIDEAQSRLPAKAREVRMLFRNAAAHFEETMKEYRSHPPVIRTFYYNRDLLDRAYGKEGHRTFYNRIYPGGFAEGAAEVGNSFLDSGFGPEAVRAFQIALDTVAKQSAREKKRSREIVRTIRRKIEMIREGEAEQSQIDALRKKTNALIEE